jgi:citrate synthase/citryl-CoA lyase
MSDSAGTSDKSGASGDIQWRTAIADPHRPDDIVLRGYSLLELIAKLPFTSAAYLTLVGRLPTEPQRRMLEAILVTGIDHGISPSSSVSRIIAASGVPIQACIAGGLLTIGDIQGGATEQFARQMVAAVEANPGRSARELAATMVGEKLARKERVEGFGHPQHPEGDPRTAVLFQVARDAGIAGVYVELALAMEDELADRKGRRIPLNVDGAIGSTMLDAGFSWRHARPLGITSRSIGLAAHAIEEVERERGWRGIPLNTVRYDGAEDMRL